ncbi:FAD-binding oxidoreductase [Mycolicibacterium mageritense]|uniref:Mitomycin radical oxidase n=1 Tax=Mycolicibacterium mageritense TaxID=53462 RepID=A0AAI8TWJ9_MYCME|nr:FAD-binding oxidoreductase [Mycolicibacterium mageritense]BDY30169.1 Mitomycin radical oxidase [Mycolicibacterium mageritense]
MAGTTFSRRNFLIGGGLAVAAVSAGRPHARAESLAGLRSAVRGRVLLSGDPGFDAARTPWNLAVDQSVRAVVDLVDADDAAALIHFARNAGVPIAVQPNGHGASDALDGAILVRTAALNDTQVDTAAGTARVGPGVSWAKVQEVAGPAGLTGVAGSSPTVSITGYTLGGGLSWFSRKFGWAAESVVAFEVITAAGERLTVTDASEPDLFWALRGGGGDYALVTSIEFALKPAPSVYGGTMVWPAERASAVLSAFRDITATAPDELSLWCSLTQFPGAPALVRIDTTYLGRADAGIALLQPLDRVGGSLSDTRRVLPVTDIGTIAEEPTKPAASRQQGTLVTGLTDRFVDTLLTQSMAPLMNVQIRHLGGALQRPSDTPAGSAAVPYLVNFIGAQANSQMGAELTARTGIYLDALAQADTAKVPFNFLAPEQSASDAFDTATLARLQSVKRRRDPEGVFRSNHPVW